MTLKSELNSIEHNYHIELWQTYKLTEETFNQLSGKFEKSVVIGELDSLNVDQKRKFKADLASYLSRRRISDKTPELVQKYVKAVSNDYVLEKRLDNLSEMAFIYVVTLMEAFVKEYLTHLFIGKPELLKSSKTITYEEILALGNMSKIRSVLAEREVDQVSYKSVDQLAEYLNSKLKLGIDDTLAWWVLCKEASYRRNIIVHNRGIVNSIYTSKIPEAPPIGTKLVVPISYLKDRTSAIKDFIAYSHKTITENLRIK